MSKERELLSYGEGLSGEISGKLRKINFAKDSKFYISLDKKLASVKTQIRRLKDTAGIDAGELSRYLELYQNGIVELLQMGYSVKILDLVQAEPVVRGSVDSASEVSSKPKFEVKITPLPLLSNAVKELSVAKVDVLEVKASITKVEGKGTADGSIAAGKAMRVVGTKLKVGAEGDGIYFAPATEHGSANADRSSWTAVKTLDMLNNMPSELLFTVPALLPSGEYVLVVETRFISAAHSRKEPLTAVSEPFAVTGLDV